VQCYPSHDFIIDDDEARTLFNHVDVPSEELYALVAELGPVAFNEAEEPLVLALTAPNAFEGDDDEDEDRIPDADAEGAVEVDAGGEEDQRGDSSSTAASVPREPQNDAGENLQGTGNTVQPIRRGK
jgi:hypothetical protein